MAKRGFIAVLVFAAGPAMAQDWNLSEMDIPLNWAQVQDLTAGRTLTYPDDGKSRFSEGGAYSYTYPDEGGTVFGRFTIEKDGRVCIDYMDGQSRCNLFVRSDEMLLMLTERGGRFPIRVELGLKP